MNVIEFTMRIEQELDGVTQGTMTPETVFVEMKEWCSLYALILMALLSTEFDIDITGEEISKISTVTDLYDFIKIRGGFSA